MLELNKQKFNHLKIHSQYSICQGAVKIEKLKDFCKERKINVTCHLLTTGYAERVSDTPNRSVALSECSGNAFGSSEERSDTVSISR